MESKRQKQVAETVKRNFGIVLQERGGYIYGSEAFVTVTNVKVSPDLSIAKIYLSVYNIEDKQNVILQLEQENAQLKQALAHRIRKHVRKIPQVDFYLDVSVFIRRMHVSNDMHSFFSPFRRFQY